MGAIKTESGLDGLLISRLLLLLQFLQSTCGFLGDERGWRPNFIEGHPLPAFGLAVVLSAKVAGQYIADFLLESCGLIRLCL